VSFAAIRTMIRQKRGRRIPRNGDNLVSREPKELRVSGVARKRSGIHLIAEMASVSIGTVDRALHGRGGIRNPRVNDSASCATNRV